MTRFDGPDCSDRKPEPAGPVTAAGYQIPGSGDLARALLSSVSIPLFKEGPMHSHHGITMILGQLTFIGWFFPGCSHPDPAIDLEAPRLIQTNLPPSPREAAVSPTFPIRLRFSEPLDPETITADTVVVVPHEEAGGPCRLDFACGDDSCYGGRCQRDRLTARWLADLENPPLTESRRRAAAPVAISSSAAGDLIQLEPSQPLAARRLHTLLVSSAVTDRAGNPLWAGDAPVPVRVIFATGPAEAARPVVSLASPPDGASGVPTNLARAVVVFSQPVFGVSPGTLWLEWGSGTRVRVGIPPEPAVCRGRQAGTCFELRVLDPLPPLQVIQLRGSGVIVDGRGQAVIAPAQAFATGAGPDTRPPRLGALRVQVADRCLVLRARTDEAADLWADGSWGAGILGGLGVKEHEAASTLPPGLVDGQVTVHLQDLAGNRVVVEDLPVALPSSARVVITEVLANPAGPEPGQEMVELYNLSPQPVDLAGWSLDDNDDGKGANLLPAGVLQPGQFAVVVGKGYNPSSNLDPLPAEGSITVVLDQTLGAGGLANSGEEIVLRDPRGGLVSTYGNHHPVSAASNDGRSIERVDPAACDVRASWQPNEEGSSTPGRGVAAD